MNPVLPERRLRDGADLIINGSTYRLTLIAGEQARLDTGTATVGGQLMRARDAERLREAMAILEEVAQEVTALNERLLDPIDGVTNRGVHALLRAPETSDAFKDALRPYAFALFKHGCNVHTERGSVIVPPVSRECFEVELAKLPAQARGSLPWRDFLDHVFEPVPLVTQGFYVFDRTDDLRRFNVLLGPEYAQISKKLRRVFDEAIREGGEIPERRWQLFDHLSQQALARQKVLLESALDDAEPEVTAVATRVHIRCYEGGTFRFLLRPYSYAFARELDRCAALLDRAHAVMPPFACETREVLADLADWCRERTDDPSWAVSRPSWIAASDPSNLIDVSLTAEEKISRLGSKGGFQLVVSAFDTVPDAVRPVLDLVQREAKQRQNLNIVWLRHLLVGGSASNATIAGEKLPDPDGYDQYKVMTFTNAVRGAMVRANAEHIVLATSLSSEDIVRLGDAANVLVLLHENGHTLGDHAAFLGEVSASVEETNAEASVLVQARRFAPAFLDDLACLLGCWMPVQRTMQGPTEPHSHANIVLFDALRAAGAVQFAERAGRTILEVVSVDDAAHVSFALAMMMRCWEAGLPEALHEEVLEPFDPLDQGQDVRLAQRMRDKRDGLSTDERQRMRQQVVAECRAFFSAERIAQLSAPLQAIVARLPRVQPLTLVPTDRRFHAVLSM